MARKGVVEMSQRSALRRPIAYSSLVVTVLLFAAIAYSADSQDEWKKTVEAAKKEAKIVAGGPPTAVLRKQYKEAFEQKFGIEMELISAPGPQNAGKAASEFKAGVRYFDVLHGGSGTLEPLMNDNMLAPFADYMILPEVKDVRQWWGGHNLVEQVKKKTVILFFFPA